MFKQMIVTKFKFSRKILIVFFFFFCTKKKKNEICNILIFDIVSKLPKPQCQGGTKIKSVYDIYFDFTIISIK